VNTFLKNACDQDKRVVRIIHGKGDISAGKPPVLKGKVNSWLRQKNEVLAFCSARPNDGGTGGVCVAEKNLNINCILPGGTKAPILGISHGCDTFHGQTSATVGSGGLSSAAGTN